MNESTESLYDALDEENERHESFYLSSLFMCSLMVDNLMWLLNTADLQDEGSCGIIMEQVVAMKELVDSALALSEITDQTTFH